MPRKGKHFLHYTTTYSIQKVAGVDHPLASTCMPSALGSGDG
jgi:hypothetical protein